MEKMNSQRGQVSTIAIVLLVVGLVAGAVGGYYFTSSSLQPKIDDYETQVANLTSEVSGLSATISSLGDEITDYELQGFHLAREMMALRALTSDMKSELDELEQVIKDHEATALANVHILSRYETDVLSLEGEVEILRGEVKMLQVLLETLLEIEVDPDLSSASYQGPLDPWYHYVDTYTEEITTRYDAKVVEGSWSLVDLGNGMFRLSMRWTELNINEEVEGAPPGTLDKFLVVLESQDFNTGDVNFMLYGDAYWQKINWDGRVGRWTSSGVEIHIMPNSYDHHFVYYHSGYVAGVGLVLYGAIGG